MCVKGEYENGYEIYAQYTLPLTFRTRFCTTTAITDIGAFYGEYCNISQNNFVDAEHVLYGASSIFSISNADYSFYKSKITEAKVFIMTIGI